jgi:hypothetical protein
MSELECSIVHFCKPNDRGAKLERIADELRCVGAERERSGNGVEQY